MGTKYFVDSDSLTSVATAIKEKTRNYNNAIEFPAAFCSSIRSLPAKPIFLPEEHELHVRKEVTRVAKEVHEVLEDDSVVFISLSDTHFNEPTSKIPTQRAAMAINALTHVIPVDFICHLGDWGANEEQIVQVKDYIESVRSNIPAMYAVGNHDAEDSSLSGDWFYDNFITNVAAPNAIIGGDKSGGGYYYYDIEDKYRKLRVFLLNTVEKTLKRGGEKYCTVTTGQQRKWLAERLVELNEKSDSATWGFIILSHHPADYGDIIPLSNLLKAYVDGTDFVIQDDYDGTNVTVDFSGKNFAKFIAQFHGHVHNFLEARLYAYDSTTSTYTAYDANKICVSGVTVDRVNHDDTEEQKFKRGFSFLDGENMLYAYEHAKTAPDSTTETSFTVNVINKSKNIIHSFHYGAGRYRPIALDGIPVYGVYTDMPNASLAEGSPSAVKENDSYNTVITIKDGYTLRSYTVTMGATDITSTNCTDNGDGTISVDIKNVTGYIRIVVIAKAPAVNLLPTALARDGSLFTGIDNEGNETLGYKMGCRVSSGSSGIFEKYASDGDVYAKYLCCTGAIPIHENAVIRIKNVTLESTNEAANGQVNISCQKTLSGSHCLRVEGASKLPQPDEDGVITIDIAAFAEANSVSAAGANYFRLTCCEISADTVITVDEFEQY